MQSHDLQVGQKVFAEIHGYPPWPGIICQVLRSSPDAVAIYFVYLYEIELYVKLTASELKNYQEYMMNHQYSNYFTTCILLARAFCKQQDVDYIALNNEDISDVSPLRNSQLRHGLCYIDIPKNELNERSSNDVEINDDSYNFEHNQLTSKNTMYAEGNKIFIERLQSLRLEVELLKYDSQIKRNLSIDGVKNSSCARAIKALDKILKLPLNERVLKKYPDIVATVLRLRLYEASVRQGDMTSKDTELLRMNVRRIRKRAFAIYRVFRKIFNVPMEVSFTRIYYLELKSCRKNKF